MLYIYDIEGFLAGTTEDENTPRTTAIAPEGAANNFVGDSWVFVDRVALEAQKAEQAAQAAEVARKQAVYDQIAEIEATITNRRIREAALTQEGKDWLAAKDAEITALRASISTP